MYVKNGRSIFWLTKTYKVKREDGTVWEKTKRWFGYKLHLIVDTVYELPLVEELRQCHEELHERAEECSGDK
jgi:hypothetical protein